jgi:hypothetical protein
MPIRTISNLPNVSDYDYRTIDLPVDTDFMQLSMLDTVNSKYNSAKVTFSNIKLAVIDAIPYTSDTVSGTVRLATDAEFTAGTSTSVAVTPEQVHGYGGDKYVTLTGGSTDLTKTDQVSNVYQIDEFTGTGIDVDNITEIHVSTTLVGSEGLESYVTSDYGNVADTTISYTLTLDNSSNYIVFTTKGDIIRVPIEVGQTEFTIQNYGFSASYTLMGVTQKIIG